MTNLTPEEHDVLVLAAAGFLAKQIAAIMGSDRKFRTEPSIAGSIVAEISSKRRI